MSVNSRVKDIEGYRGTIRYIGPVAAAKNANDVWYGIEWDDKSRGKHDGSCVDKAGKLHRYFQCDVTAGSFVKANKIKFGRTFMEALRERYVDMNAPLVAPDNIVPNAFVQTSKGNQKSIEFVGETKIRKWQQLPLINKIAIRDDSISLAGEGITQHVGHILELDLQDNLISDWNEVGLLVQQLPKLENLQMHGNIMNEINRHVIQSLPSAPSSSLSCFANLRTLALNACKISSWREILLLETTLPNIEEMYLSRNDFSDIPMIDVSPNNKTVFNTASSNNFVKNFTKLKILDISGCNLSSWGQVEAFGTLPVLQDLLLDQNELSDIREPPTDTFKTLQRMSLSSNKLQSWNDIDSLNKFPELRCLRLSHVPLFAGKGASEVRPIVIARIAQLNFFNGSAVNGRERIESEKSYLRRIFRERSLAKTSTTDDKLKDELNTSSSHVSEVNHPRFDELYALYREQMLDFGKAQENGTIASDLVSITFKNLTLSSSDGMELNTKKLPLSTTVSRLKMIVKGMYKVDIPLQQLSIRTYRDTPPVFLEDDESTLGYAGAVNGSFIYVNETD